MATRVVCSAKIENEAERRAIMAWVRTVSNDGFSEQGDVVTMSYVKQPEDPEDSGRWWGIIHTFEGYAEHTIEVT